MQLDEGLKVEDNGGTRKSCSTVAGDHVKTTGGKFVWTVDNNMNISLDLQSRHHGSAGRALTIARQYTHDL